MSSPAPVGINTPLATTNPASSGFSPIDRLMAFRNI
jgi:hypothetical protein